jgi:hypothetical protein
MDDCSLLPLGSLELITPRSCILAPDSKGSKGATEHEPKQLPVCAQVLEILERNGSAIKAGRFGGGVASSIQVCTSGGSNRTLFGVF